MLPDNLQRFATKIPVLDHGFVRLVDVMGDDGAIVEAARMSTTGQQSVHKVTTVEPDVPLVGVPTFMGRCTVCGDYVACDETGFSDETCNEGNRQLIRYMARNGHTSPFEMCEIKLHVKLPIFVARQWIRHRTWSFNEFSGRYSEMPDEAFKVAPDGWRTQDTVNRQGSAGGVMVWPPGWRVDDVGDETCVRTPAQLQSEDALEGLGTFLPSPTTPGAYLAHRQGALQAYAREVYDERLAFGVSKELARVDLPLDYYTQWTCKVNLHNLAHFLKLRLDAHAQPEIRVYAEAIVPIVAAWVPLAWEAILDYRIESATLSRQQLQALRTVVGELALTADARELVQRVFAGVPAAEAKALRALLGVG